MGTSMGVISFWIDTGSSVPKCSSAPVYEEDNKMNKYLWLRLLILGIYYFEKVAYS